MTNIEINTEIIKLDAFLKWSGVVVNGSDAKIIISEGALLFVLGKLHFLFFLQI